MSEWIRVSRAHPCPVCKRSDYCTRTTDGTAVKCMRVQSEKPATGNLGGWIHRLADPLPPAPPAKKVEKKPDWTKECKEMYLHERAGSKRKELAAQLKVSIKSLEALRVGIGWDEWNGREYSSWPSRDSDGRCIGFVRRYADGSKKTNIGGTNTGVFFTQSWHLHPGPLFVVEGGSDVAACESRCLCSIGRASNVCGAHWIKIMIQKHCPGRLVVVVGERDEDPSKRGTPSVPSCTVNCKGCSHCWPGFYGMRKVATELGGNAVALMVPTHSKDMRVLLTSGKPWHELTKLTGGLLLGAK